MILFLCWLLHPATAPAVHHIQLNGYDLSLRAPSGWELRTTDDGATVLERHGAFISLDWYNPASDDKYENFERRVDTEIRRRQQDGPVRVHRFHLGPLRGVEVKSLDKDKSIFIETFVDVPAEPRGGELFVIMLQGRSAQSGSSDMKVYDELLHAIRVQDADN